MPSENIHNMLNGAAAYLAWLLTEPEKTRSNDWYEKVVFWCDHVKWCVNANKPKPETSEDI